MADVKWIKICTDIFDDEKIVLIEGMPEADSIIAIWFKLLCLAGKQNNGGVFMLNEKMPYTEEMFSLIFRRSLNTVRLALSTFEQFGMVEIVNKTYTIPNWEKHQNTDKLDEIREYNKLKQRESRQRRKLLQDVNDNVNDMSLTCQTCQDIEEERDSEKELLTISLAREKNADVDNSVDNKDIGEASPPSSTTAPTLNDVIDFVNDNGLSVNAYRFFNYYNEKRFLTLSGRPMDWKAKIFEWDTEDKKKQRKTSSSEQNSSFELDEFFRANLERSEREYKKLSGRAAVDEGAELAKDRKKK